MADVILQDNLGLTYSRTLTLIRKPASTLLPKGVLTQDACLSTPGEAWVLAHRGLRHLPTSINHENVVALERGATDQSPVLREMS